MNEEILGLIIDRNLKFGDYAFTLFKKADRKLSALATVSDYMRNEMYVTV